MTDFLLSEKYRLEIHWDNIEYFDENKCRLIGAYFSGPVLNNAERVNDNDSINLDFCKQYYILVKEVHVLNFSWGKVEYKDNKIFLEDAIITYQEDMKLKSDDYVVINTYNHEMAVHAFNLLYDSYLVNKDNELYSFS